MLINSYNINSQNIYSVDKWMEYIEENGFWNRWWWPNGKIFIPIFISGWTSFWIEQCY